MNRLLAGAAAGLIATVPMSVVMLAGHRLLPRREQYPCPTQEIAARVGAAVSLHGVVARRTRRLAGTALHFGFGGAAGAAYGLARERLPAPVPERGVEFGLLVWLGSYLGWIPALSILAPATEHPARRNALMIAAHVVWGVALGVLTERLSQDGQDAPFAWTDWPSVEALPAAGAAD